jgi:hypothetical protein
MTKTGAEFEIKIKPREIVDFPIFLKPRMAAPDQMQDFNIGVKPRVFKSEPESLDFNIQAKPITVYPQKDFAITLKPHPMH